MHAINYINGLECEFRDKAKQYIHTRSVVFRGIFGLFSLSAFGQILAAVCAQIQFSNINIALPLPLLNVDSNITTPPLASLNSWDIDPHVCLPQTQRFRRGPKCSSKAPLTHASNFRQEVNVLRVCTGRSGHGTYRVSPI